MLSAAWFSLLVFAATLVGGPNFGSVTSAGATTRAPLALTTETPATMTPQPTPTPIQNPDPPTGPGGLGNGADGHPICPTGYQLQADGACHRYDYTGGHYYGVY
jgi:hypothetical protein